MTQITLQYIPYNTDVGFLRIKQHYLHIDFWRIAFFTHVYCSMLVLFAGFTQFSSTVLKRLPTLHRSIGYVYIINILLVTGPAGLVMSFYANGGWYAKIGFIILALLWWYFTLMALLKAKQKDFLRHRAFMIRSFALTLSALTLRSWKVVLNSIFDLTPNQSTIAIVWLGWGINLIVAEWFIQRYVVKHGSYQP